MTDRRGFHPMPRAERRVLGFLVAFSLVAFLPGWQGFELAGIELTGWMMAALMVISPVLTLWVFRLGRRRG